MRDRRFPRSRVLAFGALLAGVVLSSPSAAGQTLNTGFDPSATLEAGVRYRTLSASGPGGDQEVWVFESPCTSASCPSQTTGQRTWADVNAFSVEYNGQDLSTTIAGSTTTRRVGNLGDLNYVQIQITKNSSSTSVALNSLALNGSASIGAVVVDSAPNTKVWNITGVDLTSGFTLTGTLAISFLSGGGDSNFVQVEFGFVPPPDTEGPVVTSVVVQPEPVLLDGQATVTAHVSDLTTGDNHVGSAEYRVNDGTWTAMAAQDGTFDGVEEDVEASFTATQLGLNEVCVRGTDSVGNTGAESCQTFLVTYQFSGFFSPIENDIVNAAKAGQAVPAKWRLTDANGVPVSDPASFVDLSSYTISCTDFQGDPLDAVEEVAPGSSELQYLGDGYWQFNWKTPKTYADTCRAMIVEFNSGELSPAANFKFKK
jgi:hypothetical protein